MASFETAPRDGPARGGTGHLLWWIYLGLQALMFVAFAWVSLRDAGMAPRAAEAMAYGIVVVDALALAGLFFWLRGIPFFDAFLWRAVVLVLIARLAVGLAAFGGNLLPWDGTREQMVALVGIGSIVAALPLVVGLWCYAFRSAALWSSMDSSADERGRD